MCDKCSGEGKGFGGGLLLGGLLGAGLFFLFGTEKGRKIKKQIEKKGEKAVGEIQDLVDELAEKGQEFREKAEEVAGELREKVEEKVEDVSGEAKEQLGEKLDTAFEKIADLQDHGRELTEDIHSDLKKKFFHNIPKK